MFDLYGVTMGHRVPAVEPPQGQQVPAPAPPFNKAPAPSALTVRQRQEIPMGGPRAPG